MGRVMEQKEYLKWLDGFLPPVYSDAFQIYNSDVDISHLSFNGLDREVQMTLKSHLIGLNFQRATELLTIAYALPKDDPRVAAFRALAAINAKRGYEKIGTAGYEGQHWLPTFALLYENESKGPAPLEPEKPKTHPGESAKTTSGN
jgi:hypothetical protein